MEDNLFVNLKTQLTTSWLDRIYSVFALERIRKRLWWHSFWGVSVGDVTIIAVTGVALSLSINCSFHLLHFFFVILLFYVIGFPAVWSLVLYFLIPCWFPGEIFFPLSFNTVMQWLWFYFVFALSPLTLEMSFSPFCMSFCHLLTLTASFSLLGMSSSPREITQKVHSSPGVTPKETKRPQKHIYTNENAGLHENSPCCNIYKRMKDWRWIQSFWHRL